MQIHSVVFSKTVSIDFRVNFKSTLKYNFRTKYKMKFKMGLSQILKLESVRLDTVAVYLWRS